MRNEDRITATTTASEIDLRQLASDVVNRVTELGATAAECVVHDERAFSTVVRRAEVEMLEESASRALEVRVFVRQRSAKASSSDFSREGVEQMVRSAIELAKVAGEDPFAGIPEPNELGQITGDLNLYYDDVYSMSTAERIEYARRAEQSAMAVDPRLTDSDGGSFNATTGNRVLANSHGFVGDYRWSYCSVSVVPVATDMEGNMHRDYWYSVSRKLSKLAPPEEVGRIAAERTLRRIGVRKITTQRVPIVFDQETARALLSHISAAVNGESVCRHASYLAGKLGERVVGGNIAIMDGGPMPGGFGTLPFDGEGVPTRPTAVFENGRLVSYLLNTYTAKKLGLCTTGNASHSLAEMPGINSGNFFLQPGIKSPQEILSDVKEGLLATEFLDCGVDLATGYFSRRVSGQWIENGELAFPVEGVTLAGNLHDMWQNVAEIGNDLIWRNSVACPTLRIEGMTVAGA